jgi:hypothetical protein
MSKATFYHVPAKVETTHARRRRSPSPMTGDALRAPGSRLAGATERRPRYHPAPQFRRNRRAWLKRIALAKMQGR